MIEVINVIAWPIAAIVCALIVASMFEAAETKQDNTAEVLDRVASQAKDIADLQRKVSKLNLLRGISEE